MSTTKDIAVIGKNYTEYLTWLIGWEHLAKRSFVVSKWEDLKDRKPAYYILLTGALDRPDWEEVADALCNLIKTYGAKEWMEPGIKS